MAPERQADITWRGIHVLLRQRSPDEIQVSVYWPIFSDRHPDGKSLVSRSVASWGEAERIVTETLNNEHTDEINAGTVPAFRFPDLYESGT